MSVCRFSSFVFGVSNGDAVVNKKRLITRAIQMKTLNIFLNTIYCAEVAQSCTTFQHNLPPRSMQVLQRLQSA